MAAVYTGSGGLSQEAKGERAADNAKADSANGWGHESRVLVNGKRIKEESLSGDEEASGVQSLSHPPHHATAAAPSSSLPSSVAVKEESIDEEYFQIKLCEIKQDSDETTEDNVDRGGSHGDDGSNSGDWLFHCWECGQGFGQREAYLEHRRTHPGLAHPHSLPHDGPIVRMDLDAQWDGMLVSQEGQGGRRTFCCALCGKQFSSPRGFYGHQLTHGHQTPKREPDSPGSAGGGGSGRCYECPDCSKTYRTVGLFLNHQRSHKQASKSVFHELAQLQKKGFRCPVCGRCYSRASALQAHRRCHEVKLFKPPSVGKLKEKKEEEDEPEEEEEGKPANMSKPYECPECGRSFRSLTGLGAHQRFGSHGRPPEAKAKAKAKEEKKGFECPECGRAFLSAAALAAHQRWHARRALNPQGRPFPCEQCGKVFTSLTFYHKHQRSVHSEEAPAKSFLHQVCQLQKKAFECQDCGRRFSRPSALHSHQLCHADLYGDTLDTPAPPRPPQPPPPPPPAPPSAPETLYLCDKVEPRLFAIGALSYSKTGPEPEVDVEAISEPGSEQDPQEWVWPSGEDHLTLEKTQNPLPLPPHSSPSGAIPGGESSDADVQLDAEINCEPPKAGRGVEGGGYECPECGRIFASASAVSCHLRWHRGSLHRRGIASVWPRGQRGRRWRPGGSQQAQGGVGVGKRVFACGECGRESATLHSHQNHQRRAHGSRQPSKSLLAQLAGLQKNGCECPDCGMRFSRASALHSHRQHHTQPKPFQCQDCGRGYSSLSALCTHRKARHHRNEPATAEHCNEDKVKIGMDEVEGADAKAVTGTLAHEFNPRKTLLGPKVHHCVECGKGFWSLGAFVEHQHKAHPQKDKGEGSDNGSSPLANPRPVPAARPGPRKRQACPICGKKFRHGGVLRAHVKRHGVAPGRSLHRCEVCGKAYRFLACFIKHQRTHASPSLTSSFPSSSSTTPLTASAQSSFLQQVEQVEKNGYTCPECAKQFSRAMALQFHMRSHGYLTGYSSSPSCSNTNTSTASPTAQSSATAQCPDCVAFCPNQDALGEHCRKQHTLLDSFQKGQGVASEAQLPHGDVAAGAGEKTPTPSAPVPAPAKSLTTGGTDDSSETFRCVDCGKAFLAPGILELHRKCHGQDQTLGVEGPKSDKDKQEQNGSSTLTPGSCLLGSSPYKCPDCGRCFGTNSALGTHRRWHLDKRLASALVGEGEGRRSRGRRDRRQGGRSSQNGPFRCHQCGKGFFYFCVLRRHQMYHAETAPHLPLSKLPRSDRQSFQCPECGKAFPKASALAAHYHSHRASPAATPSSTFQCQVCGDDFASAAQLQLHQSGGDCADLEQKSPRKTLVKRKLKPLSCPDCGKRFFRPSGLGAHRWYAHVKCSKAGEQGGGRAGVGAPGPLLKDLCTKPFPCLACGKSYSSQGALYNHRKICGVPQQKRGCTPPRAAAAATLPPPPRLSLIRGERGMCLFKCHKCGKAFCSPEELATHHQSASSKPHSCALCCRGYWTEVQLQQHLSWHDSIRRRLPADLRYRLGNADQYQDIEWGGGSLSVPTSASPTPPPPVSTSPPKAPQCSVCLKGFATPFSLRRHQAAIHSPKHQPGPLGPSVSTVQGQLGKRGREHGEGEDKEREEMESEMEGEVETGREVEDRGREVEKMNINTESRRELREKCQSEMESREEEQKEGGSESERRTGTEEEEEQQDGPVASLFPTCPATLALPLGGAVGSLACIECGITFGQELELHRHYIEHARGGL